MSSFLQVQIKMVEPTDVVTIHGQMSPNGKGVSGADILNALRAVNGLRKNDNDEEELHLQYNSQHFVFKPGESTIVPEDVAWGLRNSSQVMLDRNNPLSTPFACAIVEERRFTPGVTKQFAVPKTFREHTETTCPVCKEDQGSFDKLAAHISERHVAKKAEERRP